jgi:hypothetical protein
MSTKPGSIYKVGARRYVDSQALYNLAGTHEVVPQADGWRVLAGAGAVRCALVEGRPELPRQRGALYELSAEGRADLKAERAAWLARGLVQPAGTFESWPGEPAAKAGCGCGATCGCGPCRLRHGHAQHDHS